MRTSSNGNLLIEEFVNNKAISRQYHTLFQWESGNANSFFGLFGSDFKTYMKKKVKEDDVIADSIKAFLEVGNDRNRLVHQNFGAFTLDKDAKEIFELYQKARPFVEGLSSLMSDFINPNVSINGILSE